MRSLAHWARRRTCSGCSAWAPCQGSFSRRTPSFSFQVGVVVQNSSVELGWVVNKSGWGDYLTDRGLGDGELETGKGSLLIHQGGGVIN
eukprot:751727-Hanusia_phi.AAC.3